MITHLVRLCSYDWPKGCDPRKAVQITNPLTRHTKSWILTKSGVQLEPLPTAGLTEILADATRPAPFYQECTV